MRRRHLGQAVSPSQGTRGSAWRVFRALGHGMDIDQPRLASQSRSDAMPARPNLVGWFLALIAVVVNGGLLRSEDASPARGAVREALQREIYGLEDDRQQLLTTAARRAPNYAPARWHQGFVSDGKQGWIGHAEFLSTANRAARIAAYELQRERASDT